MVSFAGHALPLHYPTGILAEHRHTRNAAGLFDVSHMGQGRLDSPRESSGPAAFQAVATAFERLVPGDIAALQPGQIRYTVLTNQAGGILDDLMVMHGGDHLFIIVNAATCVADFAHMRTVLSDEIRLTELTDRALLALQGPQAVGVMERLVPDTPFRASGALPFMNAMSLSVAGLACQVSRSGYTGEDGFELSVATDQAVTLAERLLAGVCAFMGLISTLPPLPFRRVWPGSSAGAAGLRPISPAPRSFLLS
ncbi:MAG: aminomethyltransferase [Rhodospirillaceae bacterium]|nr:MAG: aminomethyltransferase [Rhodospirillaceae bacterium]